MAAGIEDSLIAKIRPPWNGGEKLKPADPEPPAPVIGTFQFTLQPTYYDRGFLNVPVAASELLGEDDDLVWYDEGRPLSQFIIDMWLETCTGGK